MCVCVGGEGGGGGAGFEYSAQIREKINNYALAVSTPDCTYPGLGFISQFRKHIAAKFKMKETQILRGRGLGWTLS